MAVFLALGRKMGYIQGSLKSDLRMEVQRALFRERMSNFKKTQALIIFLLAVLGITIFQDYLQANYQSYAFYLSESLLFNIFWILFLPVSLLVRLAFTRFKALRTIRPKWAIRPAFVLIATICHLLLFALLVFAISGLFYEHTFSFAGNLNYSISNDLYKYLLIYTAISLIPLPKKAEATASDRHAEFLIVPSGTKTEKIPTDSILYISSATPYVEIWTGERKSLLTASLKSLAKKLDPSVFVRVHKTALVNINKVASLNSRRNGDYDLKLDNGQELRLSRNYVQEFRKLFQHASTG
jgi:two-component system LytT family response regulator